MGERLRSLKRSSATLLGLGAICLPVGGVVSALGYAWIRHLDYENPQWSAKFDRQIGRLAQSQGFQVENLQQGFGEYPHDVQADINIGRCTLEGVDIAYTVGKSGVNKIYAYEYDYYPTVRTPGSPDPAPINATTPGINFTFTSYPNLQRELGSNPCEVIALKESRLNNSAP